MKCLQAINELSQTELKFQPTPLDDSKLSEFCMYFVTKVQLDTKFGDFFEDVVQKIGMKNDKILLQMIQELNCEYCYDKKYDQESIKGSVSKMSMFYDFVNNPWQFWTKDEVRDWINSITKEEKIGKIFFKECISGNTLDYIANEKCLKEILGITLYSEYAYDI